MQQGKKKVMYSPLKKDKEDKFHFFIFLWVNEYIAVDKRVGVVILEPPTEVFQSVNLWHCTLPQNFLAAPTMYDCEPQPPH